MVNPDSPKDQSQSTLTEEFAGAMSVYPDPLPLSYFCVRHEKEILAALRSPTREAARSEALREAAAAADDEACASCRGCKTFSTRILALQDRATSVATGRPEPGQGGLNYYVHGPDADMVCTRCEFNASAHAREAEWKHDAKRAEAVRAEREAHSLAAHDVIAERLRQMSAEVWTPKHDDAHTDDSLAMVAAIYALPEEWRDVLSVEGGMELPALWPRSWHPSWWKPKDRRRDLIRAGALIIAEIERLDRARATAGEKEGT